MEYIVFYLFAAVSITAAVLVVLQKKAVYSALALIVCFGGMAGLFFQLGAQFIAAIQVIVYAGAIMVLFVFVIMLVDPEADIYPGSRLRYIAFWAIPLAVLLVFLLIQAFPGFLGSSPGNVTAQAQPQGSVENIARALFTQYVVPFEVTSILILVAIIGAMVLAKRSD